MTNKWIEEIYLIAEASLESHTLIPDHCNTPLTSSYIVSCFGIERGHSSDNGLWVVIMLAGRWSMFGIRFANVVIHIS